MKLLLVVLAAAAVIGGFVGAYFEGRSFSLIGAAIGAVGTATVLLSLGAYFTAQERKRKKDELPTEVRAVFDRMLGVPDTAASKTATPGWKPRPFHELRTKADQLSWFANAPEWRSIDRRLIQLLVERLHGNQMFEVFVHASQDSGLVAQYRPLSALFDAGVGELAAAAKVAEMLCTAGVAQGERFARMLHSGRADKNELSALYSNAMNALEAAVQVEPRYVVAYLRLAELRNLVGRKDDALRFVEQGLAQVRDLKSYPLPTRPGMELRQSVDEVEAALSAMSRQLSQ